MKKQFLLIIALLCTSALAELGCAPKDITQFKEIGAIYNQPLSEHFNKLTPQERVFIYYLFRASLPCNSVTSDQLHRHAVEIRELFEYIIEHKVELQRKNLSFNAAEFLDQATKYLVYLWTNHSQYFQREQANEKRTPHRLGLNLLTQDNLTAVLEALNYDNARRYVDEIKASIYDVTVESTLTVPGSIEKSAVNFYSPNFSEADFQALPAKGQTAVNAYCFVEGNGKNKKSSYTLCSAFQKYAKELNVAAYWLDKARVHAQQYPDQFDEHVVKSLEYLVEHLKTGDDLLFKKHCIEWLQTKSRVDYCFGFHETYADPKAYRATLQSDITIKALDMTKVNEVLPKLELQLPFKSEYKRDNLEAGASMPNASVNVKAFTAGFLGPLNIVMAYCLPNYEEIRSEHGSKQIMYHAEDAIGELMNQSLYRRLFNGSHIYDWSQKYDPMFQLDKDLLMVHVILHETLGHGSGKLAHHIFKDGDNLTIGGKTYQVGDTIPVTSDNLPQFLTGYSAALEELRAEIIALLSSIISYDKLAKVGLYKDWPEKIGKEKIVEMNVVSMMRFGLLRLRNLSDDAIVVTGDHARANTTINNYLIDRGGVVINEELITVDGNTYTVLDPKVVDMQKALDAIIELAEIVQEIKSTGDGQKGAWLIDTYGTQIRNRDYMHHLKRNYQATAGDVKVTAMLYPYYKPVVKDGSIIDIDTSWPNSIVEQYQRYKELTYSME